MTPTNKVRRPSQATFIMPKLNGWPSIIKLRLCGSRFSRQTASICSAVLCQLDCWFSRRCCSSWPSMFSLLVSKSCLSRSFCVQFPYAGKSLWYLWGDHRGERPLFRNEWRSFSLQEAFFSTESRTPALPRRTLLLAGMCGFVMDANGKPESNSFSARQKHPLSRKNPQFMPTAAFAIVQQRAASSSISWSSRLLS